MYDSPEAAKFDEGDSVVVTDTGYDVVFQDFSTGDCIETRLRDARGEVLSVVSVDWTDSEPEYNLADDESNRVWSVPESDLRRA